MNLISSLPEGQPLPSEGQPLPWELAARAVRHQRLGVLPRWGAVQFHRAARVGSLSWGQSTSSQRYYSHPTALTPAPTGSASLSPTRAFRTRARATGPSSQTGTVTTASSRTWRGRFFWSPEKKKITKIIILPEPAHQSVLIRGVEPAARTGCVILCPELAMRSKLFVGFVLLFVVAQSLIDVPPCAGSCIASESCHAHDGQQTCNQFYSFNPGTDTCQYNSALQQTICWNLWQATGTIQKCKDPATDCPPLMLGAQCKLVPSGGGEWCIGGGGSCAINHTQAKACNATLHV
jgi:hypothetical protein